jgi:hypothetical protein
MEKKGGAIELETQRLVAPLRVPYLHAVLDWARLVISSLLKRF